MFKYIYFTFTTSIICWGYFLINNSFFLLCSSYQKKVTLRQKFSLTISVQIKQSNGPKPLCLVMIGQLSYSCWIMIYSTCSETTLNTYMACLDILCAPILMQTMAVCFSLFCWIQMTTPPGGAMACSWVMTMVDIQAKYLVVCMKLSSFCFYVSMYIWVKMPRKNNGLFDVLNLIFLAAYCCQLWFCWELR